jgi:hypothetical protein
VTSLVAHLIAFFAVFFPPREYNKGIRKWSPRCCIYEKS